MARTKKAGQIISASATQETNRRKKEVTKDVREMTDVELRNALVDRGVQVGPIFHSTRAVYEKRLMGLFKQEQNQTGAAGSSSASTTSPPRTRSRQTKKEDILIDATPKNRRVTRARQASKKSVIECSSDEDVPPKKTKNNVRVHTVDEEEDDGTEKKMDYTKTKDHQLNVNSSSSNQLATSTDRSSPIAKSAQNDDRHWKREHFDVKNKDEENKKKDKYNGHSIDHDATISYILNDQANTRKADGSSSSTQMKCDKKDETRKKVNVAHLHKEEDNMNTTKSKEIIDSNQSSTVPSFPFNDQVTALLKSMPREKEKELIDFLTSLNQSNQPESIDNRTIMKAAKKFIRESNRFTSRRRTVAAILITGMKKNIDYEEEDEIDNDDQKTDDESSEIDDNMEIAEESDDESGDNDDNMDIAESDEEYEVEDEEENIDEEEVAGNTFTISRKNILEVDSPTVLRSRRAVRPSPIYNYSNGTIRKLSVRNSNVLDDTLNIFNGKKANETAEETPVLNSTFVVNRADAASTTQDVQYTSTPRRRLIPKPLPRRRQGAVAADPDTAVGGSNERKLIDEEKNIERIRDLRRIMKGKNSKGTNTLNEDKEIRMMIEEDQSLKGYY